MNQASRDLIAAFQAGEQNEVATVLLDEEDGFDVSALRVLAAWTTMDHRWTEPDRPCPDGGRPTARAYAWLMSGLSVDYTAIADAAGTSRATARAKMSVLLGSRLVYPDGQIAKVAKACLQASLAKRIRKLQPKPPAAGSHN